MLLNNAKVRIWVLWCRKRLLWHLMQKFLPCSIFIISVGRVAFHIELKFGDQAL